MTALARPAQFDAAAQRRRSLIAKVHIAQKQLGLTEDDYRDILFDVAGRRSAGDCTEGELIKLVKHFESRGFTGKVKPGAAKPADHPFALKARALWISLHQLGAIDNPSEQALEAFARRQLGVAKLQWADQALAYRMIEGLKGMAERAGWSQDLAKVKPEAKLIALKRRLVDAILAKMKAEGVVPADWDVATAAFRQGGFTLEGGPLEWPIADLDALARLFGRKLREHVEAGR